MARFEVLVTETVQAHLRDLAPSLTKVQRSAIQRTLRNLAEDPYLDVVKGRTTTTVDGHTLLVQILPFMYSAILITYHIIGNAVVEVIGVHVQQLPTSRQHQM